MHRRLQVIRRGAEAALVASVPQVILPKIEEKLLLEFGEDADLGPRLIERLAKATKRRLPEDMKWLGASAFHFGYAAFWGVLYALAYERRPVHPLVGGGALAGLIYLITFPSWGGAVVTGTERPPEARSWRVEVVLWTAVLSFGLGTALLYGKGPRREPSPAPGADACSGKTDDHRTAARTG
jgi:hypothetical protein